MKKSIIFLINGLGIEKPGSYSISIDQCMPKLSRIKETSYYTSAIINSLEYRSAYEQFYLGDTYQKEINYIKDYIINENLKENPTYQSFLNSISKEQKKIHVFLEPNNEKVVNLINDFISTLPLDNHKEVFLHLLLTQQTVNEYHKLIQIINYIKYHINSHITVGFIIGKELYSEEMSKEELDVSKKLLFYCSAERWSETEKKLLSLQENNIRPCVAPGFCALNTCNIENGDTILFFNTKQTTYDKFLKAIFQNAESVFEGQEVDLPIYSMIQLDTTYSIPCFSNNIVYDDSLAKWMEKANKKALIIAEEKNLKLIHFLANGLNYITNPNIQFMKSDQNYLSSPENISNIIDKSPYDLIIFDYHMDVSKTINDLKEQLGSIDQVLGLVGDVCMNKHSLFITSLYGLKKTLPLADYNAEMVTIDYEMQIPIFFFDYTYPRSKYALFPGETHDILGSAICCIWPNTEIYNLVREKGIVNNLLKAFKKQ